MRIEKYYSNLTSSSKKVWLVVDIVVDNSLANLYIEFWGLTSNVTYRQNMAFKKATYQKNQLQLVELFEEDMKNLNTLLHKKLSQLFNN
jgi:hypothetical protein